MKKDLEIKNFFEENNIKVYVFNASLLWGPS